MNCKRGGCGNSFTPNRRGRPREYCADCPPGRRGTCKDCGKQIKESATRCNRCAQIVRWSDPEERARIRRSLNHPDMRAKISVAVKDALRRPGVKARHRAAQKEAQGRADVRAKKSAAMKARWQDSGFRERMLAAINRPEVKAKMIAAAVRMWGDVDYQKKQRRDTRWVNFKVANQRAIKRLRLARIAAAHKRARRRNENL